VQPILWLLLVYPAITNLEPRQLSLMNKCSLLKSFVKLFLYQHVLQEIMKIDSRIMSALIAVAVLSGPFLIGSSMAYGAIAKDRVKGALTSLQNDEGGNPAWIVSGVFGMDNLNSTSPILNATFYMMKTDGTAPHTHTISNFKLIGEPVVNDNATIFNGTSTVTMKDGPVNDVPISIKLIDDSAVSIWFDPLKTNKHFGNTIVYGTQHLICLEKPEYCT
jgi:hypothetical protein